MFSFILLSSFKQHICHICALISNNYEMSRYILFSLSFHFKKSKFLNLYEKFHQIIQNFININFVFIFNFINLILLKCFHLNFYILYLIFQCLNFNFENLPFFHFLLQIKIYQYYLITHHHFLIFYNFHQSLIKYLLIHLAILCYFF